MRHFMQARLGFIPCIKLLNSMADRDDVEQCRAVLQECPPGHLDRARSLSDLANSLGDRFERQGVLADLDEAIELHRAALVLRPPDHSDSHLSMTLPSAFRTDSSSRASSLTWMRLFRFIELLSRSFPLIVLIDPPL